MTEKPEKQESAPSPAAKDAPGPQKRKMPMSVRLLLFFLMVTAVVFFPSTVVIGVCLIPSFIAALIDRQAQRTAWITVGAMNFAGTLPAWFSLWENGHTLSAAVAIISSPRMLVIAFGGAGVGWFLYNRVTPMVAALVVGKNERRLKNIDKRQKDLIRKWGEEVMR